MSDSWRRPVRFVFCLVLLGVLCGHGRPSAQTAPRLVVLLHSYDTTYPWTRDLDAGIVSTLAPAARQLVTRVEYLDARNESRPDVRANLAAVLLRKYEGVRPALVVATDDAAVEFLVGHPELFTDVPVVFGGVNSAELAARLPRSRFAGLTEPTEVNRLIAELLSLRRDTRRIVIVTDKLRASVELREAIETAARTRGGLDVLPLSGDVLTFADIKARLAAETLPTDLVIVRPPIVDRDGRPVEPNQALADILAASRAPVVSPTVSDVGQGLLAGIASTGLEHGRRIGLKALAVLDGTPVERVGIEPAIDDQLVFDAQQLTRWGLSETDLPVGSAVVNHPPSFYRANKVLIWSGLAALVVQSAIIGALIVVARSRRRALVRLEEQAEALAASNRQLDLTNRSLREEQEGRRRAEEALQQSQKMDALGRLAGGVAHDFNNLLTVILGHSKLLTSHLPADSMLRGGAEEILAASHQAATLTRQLLTFSRRQVTPLAVCDVATALSRIEPIVRRLVTPAIALRMDVGQAIRPIRVGEGQLEQVVLNLVTNARDAMPDGGRLTLTVREELLPTAPGGWPDLQPGPFVVVRVADSGVGMDPETMQHVFEPFFTTKDAGRGTGIGLATVYGIARQHGGAVTVESAPHAGATFTVYFPIEATPSTVEPAPVGHA